MIWIDWLGRVALGAMGIGLLCMVVFLVEESERKAESTIERWWILFDDIKKQMIPWQRAMTTVSATKTREFLDYHFPPPAFSKRTTVTASMFTVGLFMLVIGSIYAENPIQHYFYVSLGLAELLLAFIPSKYPKWKPILYGAALINLLFWGFYAIYYFYQMVSGLPRDGSIANTGNYFIVSSVFFTASIVGPMIVLIILRMVRYTLIRVEQTQSEWRAIVGLFLPAIGPWIVMLSAYPFRDTLYGDLFFKLTTVCFPAIALATLILFICSAIAVVMIFHRLFYPVLHKTIWLIDAHKLVKNKRLLLALAGACLLGAWKGQGFSESILKILGFSEK